MLVTPKLIYPILVIIINIFLIITAVKLKFIDHDCSTGLDITGTIITASIGNILGSIMLIVDSQIDEETKLIYQASIGIWLSHLCWNLFFLMFGLVLIGLTQCSNKNPLIITNWIFIFISMCESLVGIINTGRSIRDYNTYSIILQYANN